MSSEPQGLRHFLRTNPGACHVASVDRTHLQSKPDKIIRRHVKVAQNQCKDRTALVLGAGVSGLTTAYELLASHSGMKVTVLEARDRTGGRCLSLRNGDFIVEDKDSSLSSEIGSTQRVHFDRPHGDAEPYLNAGPGRIPSSHTRLLHYLKKFGVALEIYVMNSGSNLCQVEGGPYDSSAIVYRRIEHNIRGWLAQLVHENAEELLRLLGASGKKNEADLLKDLMVTFGQLSANGSYMPMDGPPGQDSSSRAGFVELPGVVPGDVSEALPLKKLLDLQFWKKLRFYQPVDYDWQPTMFQPVGGMDNVEKAFAKQVMDLGGDIHLHTTVTKIDWDPKEKQFVVTAKKTRLPGEPLVEYRAHYLFCNMALPFLENILSESLQGITGGGLLPDFKRALRAVYKAQNEGMVDDDGFTYRFLANTTKVGWQGDRSLWQGIDVMDFQPAEMNSALMEVPEPQEGVVPIFGGISWTDDAIQQIWYPSNAYHDKTGIVVGAYNFSRNAAAFGKMSPNERIARARIGAKKFGEKFGEGLRNGVTIAWQNIPHIKGGWSQWFTVKDSVKHFNVMTQGSSINDAYGGTDVPVFFIVGDQVSSLPGWQEGAVSAALNAISRVARPDLEIPYLATLPDPRLMVEGV